jgi:hypothetical protein
MINTSMIHHQIWGVPCFQTGHDKPILNLNKWKLNTTRLVAWEFSPRGSWTAESSAGGLGFSVETASGC